MANHILDLPDFAKMVGTSLAKAIEDAVYDEIRPITDRIARNAAKRIANSVKGYAHYTTSRPRGTSFTYEPTILLEFNSEDVKF